MKKITLFLAFFVSLSLAVTASPSMEDHAEQTATEHASTDGEHAPDAAHAEHHGVHLDGGSLSLWWGIPFIGILLSIAVFPLVNLHFWEHHYGKISLFWFLVFIVSFFIEFGGSVTLFYILETYILEFIPFITLLLALFTVSGGIRLKGELIGSPLVNIVILVIGTLLASWMGTTGAAMLLIRPLIRANAWRRNNKHVIIFFIFLVANVGGSLSPLGDPPLFLGFLNGVSFFWPTEHLILPMAFVSILLLGIFYFLDSYFYSNENKRPEKDPNGEKLGLDGAQNIILLPAVVFAALCSSFDLGETYIYHFSVLNGSLLQVALFLIITLVSLKITKTSTRELNKFSWEPILEVAKLFATIFMTMVPVIAILKAGESGALANLLSMVKTADGSPNHPAYFWMTGILSSFLDNAPTYMVFFNTAGGKLAVQELMTTESITLLAISCGAVFMGAVTYIGNAPNFMVKSIAEENKIKMPSFIGYMGWSLIFLIPVFLLVTWVFF